MLGRRTAPAAAAQRPGRICCRSRPPVAAAQVEEACCLAWFLSDACFEQLREQSKDARGVALPNFLHSGAFHSVYTSREQTRCCSCAVLLMCCAAAVPPCPRVRSGVRVPLSAAAADPAE